jgi:SAM-dependent methyltransferase
MSTTVENNFRWDCCPLCHSSDVRMIGRADYSGKVNFSTQKINLSNPPEIWVCNLCHSEFVQNIIPEAIAEELYASSQAGERWSRIPFDQLKTSEVVSDMAVILKKGGHVLDVGCNTGELLDFAARLGCKTSGMEYSDSSREVVHNKGHAAYKSFDEISGQFEVITAFDLVEHLYDVPGFLDTCHGKLVGGGKLIILTGDIQSVSAKAAGAHWWYVQHPEHIVFPSRMFYEELHNFRLESWFPTYAAEAYKYPFYILLLSMIKRIITGNKYSGQPSLNPDHALIVLTKVNSQISCA